jgi:hypothetical protein
MVAVAEGDKVIIYHHAQPGVKVGKGIVVEAPALHFNKVLAHYIRVRLIHSYDRALPRGTEVMVAKRNCKKLVAKEPDATPA